MGGKENGKNNMKKIISKFIAIFLAGIFFASPVVEAQAYSQLRGKDKKSAHCSVVAIVDIVPKGVLVDKIISKKVYLEGVGTAEIVDKHIEAENCTTYVEVTYSMQMKGESDIRFKAEFEALGLNVSVETSGKISYYGVLSGKIRLPFKHIPNECIGDICLYL